MRISDWSSDVCSSDLMASATSAQSEQGDPADAEAGNISEEQPSVPVEVDAEKLRRFAGSIVMGKADREIVLESLGCFNDVASLATAIGLPEEMVGEQFRSEEHTSELQSLMRISYAVFCL